MESRETKSVPQLSLQWHHHHKALVSLLDVLWEKQELVDVTLAAEGQYLQVHRIVLCACSSYFKVTHKNLNRRIDNQTWVCWFSGCTHWKKQFWQTRNSLPKGCILSWFKSSSSLHVQGTLTSMLVIFCSLSPNSFLFIRVKFRSMKISSIHSFTQPSH